MVHKVETVKSRPVACAKAVIHTGVGHVLSDPQRGIRAIGKPL
jgi:hypothetical protein